MKIAVYSPDSKLPPDANLAMRKVMGYYKSKGDEVDLLDNMAYPDKIFVSVVFPKNKGKYYGLEAFYPGAEIIWGGSGINYNELPYEIEHTMPDYTGINYSLGFTSRGCIRDCSFCIVPDKEGSIRHNADLKEFVHPDHDNLMLFDNNILADKEYPKTLKDIADRGLKVDFNQGLDIRLINEKNAKLLSDLKYYNQHFKLRMLKFAYDNSRIKSSLDRGLNILFDHGIKPKHLMFYILANPNNVKDALERANYIMSLGCTPYIMKENQLSSPELTKVARFFNRLYFQFVKWEDFIY